MLAALLSHKHLIRELVWRDVRSRYVGSLIGLAWSVLNPLVLLAVYTFVALIFLARTGQQISALDLAAHILAALLPWMSFQESLHRSTIVFIENTSLIQKQRFPLRTLPAKVVLAGLFHQIVATALFALVLLMAGRLQWTHLLWLPVLMVIQAIMSYGLGLTLACLNTFFRDIAQALGMVMLALFWATPIVYGRRLIDPQAAAWLFWNPLTHMAEAYQWALLGEPRPDWLGLSYWTAFALASLLLGRLTLKRTHRDLVDFL